MKEKIRVQKMLASCGIASRRKAELLISEGKVKINGNLAILGDKITPFKDKVTVCGKQVISAEKNYYIMLYKPRGFITTMSDEKGRKTVKELVNAIDARIYPIGRLDKNSEGLLLMTNDGEFANKIMHPSKHIKKTYRVTVCGQVSESILDQIRDGIVIEGRRTLPAQVALILQNGERSVLSITLQEGRNRQIRKMCDAIGLQIKRLKRTAIGTLRLGMLKPGQWRELQPDEVRACLK